MNFSHNGNRKRCITLVSISYYGTCIKRSHDNNLVNEKLNISFLLFNNNDDDNNNILDI